MVAAPSVAAASGGHTTINTTDHTTGEAWPADRPPAAPPSGGPGGRTLLFMGTGTSVGVPVVGCSCTVCQSTDPRDHRTRSGAALLLPGGTLLIDTPPDLRTQLLREKLTLAHAVLYTHQHADHVFGLDDIRVFCGQLGGPLPIYCEPAVENFLRRAFSYAFDPEVQQYPAGGLPKMEFRRIDRPSATILGQSVVPIPLRHGRYDVLGFRFDKVAYCTDVNRIPEESWPLLADLDVLVLDALRFDPHPTHFSLDEALAVIERVKPKRAYLTHISCKLIPDVARRFLPANVELAYDGLRVPF